MSEGYPTTIVIDYDVNEGTYSVIRAHNGLWHDRDTGFASYEEAEREADEQCRVYGRPLMLTYAAEDASGRTSPDDQ